jgi:CBS domain-containing protein
MSKKSIPILSIMTGKVITATADETIKTVCKLMYENDIGSIVIAKRTVDDANKPVGIITERDIIRQIGLSELFVVQAPIRQIMSTPLVTIGPNNPIMDAKEIMQNKKIRRLVVIDEIEKLIGIITIKDALKEM